MLQGHGVPSLRPGFGRGGCAAGAQGREEALDLPNLPAGGEAEVHGGGEHVVCGKVGEHCSGGFWLLLQHPFSFVMVWQDSEKSR